MFFHIIIYKKLSKEGKHDQKLTKAYILHWLNCTFFIFGQSLVEAVVFIVFFVIQLGIKEVVLKYIFCEKKTYTPTAAYFYTVRLGTGNFFQNKLHILKVLIVIFISMFDMPY